MMFDKEKYEKILIPVVIPFKKNQCVEYAIAVSIAKKLMDINNGKRVDLYKLKII